MRAYLDHNATAPLRPEARAALLAAIDPAGNASSPHREGQRARAVVELARRQVAALVGAAPREVVFTASGSEAINLGLAGFVQALAGGRDHVVVSAVEHEAVLGAAEGLRSEGVRVSRVPVDDHGRLRLEALAEALDERTALVAVMAANNETGVLQPVAEAARLAHARGAVLLVDAVQAAGRIACDVRVLGADFVAISAHKLGGLAGAGALVLRRGLPLEPLVRGGGQEDGRRAGTEAAAVLAAFGAAAEAAGRDLAGEAVRLAALRDELERRLLAALPIARVNGRDAPRLPNTVSLTVPGSDAQSLVVRLDLEGVAASTGAACAAGAAEPSHVLAAMGLDPPLARATLRFSLGWSSSPRDIELAVEALRRAVAAQQASGLVAGPAVAP